MILANSINEFTNFWQFRKFEHKKLILLGFVSVLDNLNILAIS